MSGAAGGDDAEDEFEVWADLDLPIVKTPHDVKTFLMIAPDDLADRLRAERADGAREALVDVLARIKTHNDGPITPKALRWAATHEALCRSWIFDVLTGLADEAESAAAHATQDPK